MVALSSLALPGARGASVGFLLAGLAAGAAAAGVARSVAMSVAQGRDSALVGAGAGGLAAFGLGALDGGALLRWTYGVGEQGARAALPDVGLVLALALLASLGGAVLLGADALAGGTRAAPRSILARGLGRRSLLLAWGLVAIGLGLLMVRTWRVAHAWVSWEVALLALLLVLIALAVASDLMAADLAARSADGSGLASTATRAAAALATAAVLAVAVEDWFRGGSYLTRDVEQLGAAALVGLAANEPTRGAAALRAMLVLALLAAIVR